MLDMKPFVGLKKLRKFSDKHNEMTIPNPRDSAAAVSRCSSN